MKSVFFAALVASQLSLGATLSLPWTSNAASVQAILKKIVFEGMQAQRPTSLKVEGVEYSGSYFNIGMSDRDSAIRCLEGSSGMTAVQSFNCRIIERSTPTALQANRIEMRYTMNAGSVQATIKNALYSMLQKGGIDPRSGTQLYGNYGEVTLEDEASRVRCTESSLGMLAVQQFNCVFSKK